MMGVDYELFWTLNPKSLSPFVKAFNLKQKYDDTMAWALGNYIKHAIVSSFSKTVKYPLSPMLSSNVKRDMEPEEIKQKMFQRMAMVNQRFGKEEVIER
jgi:hypothetical protein